MQTLKGKNMKQNAMPPIDGPYQILTYILTQIDKFTKVDKICQRSWAKLKEVETCKIRAKNLTFLKLCV